jgi:hypothetical protein
MKPVDNAKVLDEVRPAVPTFKAHWPDCGVVELDNGGTCTIAACNSLVAAGALAGSFMLKEEEMLGNGGLPYLRCRPETLEYWRRHPEKVTPPVTYLLETMALLMTTNNKVKKVLEHYFNASEIQVLCVDVDKEAKAKAKKHTNASTDPPPIDIFVSCSMIICCAN